MTGVMSNVVVVDDKPHFPLHVWRALSRALEFGGEDAPEPDASARELGFDRSWNSDIVRVLWHDGKRKTVDDLIARLRCMPQGEVLWILLDMRLGGPASVTDYWTAVVSRECLAPRDKVLFFSSYDTHAPACDGGAIVYSKTRESLLALADEKLELSSVRPMESLAGKHVLVTGAGFELQGHRFATGLPLTSEILNEMDWSMPARTLNDKKFSNTLDAREAFQFKPKRPGFPLPDTGGIVSDHGTDLEELAEAMDLDEYWDLILRWANEAPAPERRERELRDYTGPRRYQLESALREAFRRSIVKYDIGHLRQALRAAELNWTAWLTTNYTNFSDRALDRAGAGARARPWRRVRTAVDAEVLHNEGMHQHLDERLFVKLHGDIGMAHTMALAASDKLPHSRMAVPVKLGVMYAAASNWLRAKLAGTPCTWHIVGHSLRDKVLLSMLSKLITGPAIQTFRIVSPSPQKPRVALEEALTGSARFARFEEISEKAEPYMRSIRAITDDG